MGTIVQAVLTGTAILLAGTIPRNILFAANFRYLTNVPWAVPLTAAYIWDSNFDLWLHGQAEWQAAPGPAALVWTTGADAAFLVTVAAFVLVTAASIAAFVALRRTTRTPTTEPAPVEAV